MEEGHSAAGLNFMDFPALRRNPFLKIKKSPASLVLASKDSEGAILSRLPRPKLPLVQEVHTLVTPLNLSPLKPSKNNMLTVKSNGLTSCFTADTIEKVIEDIPSFMHSDINHSRQSGQDLRATFFKQDSSYQRPTTNDLEKRMSRQSSTNKHSNFRDRKSKGKETISKASREGSAARGSKGESLARTYKTGCSPRQKSPMKVFHDFMKDV